METFLPDWKFVAKIKADWVISHLGIKLRI